MLVLIVEPEKAPVAKEISGSLKEMQEIVCGYIQAIYPFEEQVALVCNEEGLIMGLPANRGLRNREGFLYNIICGTFFLCGAPAESDHFTSLTTEQIEKFEKLFHTPEIFVQAEGQIVCLPVERGNMI